MIQAGQAKRIRAQNTRLAPREGGREGKETEREAERNKARQR